MIIGSILLHKRFNDRWIRIFSTAIIVLYLCGLMWITILSRTQEAQAIIRLSIRQIIEYYQAPDGSSSGFRFLPIYEQSWLNILMFIPVGYLVPIVLRTKSKSKALLIGMALSTFIEVLQLITRRGWFDLDDVFLNSIGSIIGTIIIHLLWKYHINGFEEK